MRVKIITSAVRNSKPGEAGFFNLLVAICNTTLLL